MGQARLHAGQAIGVLASVVEGAAAAPTALDVVAGSETLDIQAHADLVRIQSRGALRGASAQAPVELAAANTIHVATSGGASLTIAGGSITIACPGTITVHAGSKSFVGPAQQGYPLPQFPRSSCKSCILDAMRQGTPGVLV
ncbi:VGR-related protein [Stenotrophomonas maltophilia SKK35]|nr:VGR-related protein [Stenotrophomonas maltophilia SKK35]